MMTPAEQTIHDAIDRFGLESILYELSAVLDDRADDARQPGHQGMEHAESLADTAERLREIASSIAKSIQ